MWPLLSCLKMRVGLELLGYFRGLRDSIGLLARPSQFGKFSISSENLEIPTLATSLQ